MINVLNADPTKKENVSSIEKYLRNVESHLIFAAQTKFGSEFMNRWMDRFREAWEKPDAGTPTGAASKFVPGLPRGQRWVRVQVSTETPKEEVEKLAKESGLACKSKMTGTCSSMVKEIS